MKVTFLPLSYAGMHFLHQSNLLMLWPDTMNIQLSQFLGMNCHRFLFPTSLYKLTFMTVTQKCSTIFTYLMQMKPMGWRWTTCIPLELSTRILQSWEDQDLIHHRQRFNLLLKKSGMATWQWLPKLSQLKDFSLKIVLKLTIIKKTQWQKFVFNDSCYQFISNFLTIMQDLTK